MLNEVHVKVEKALVALDKYAAYTQEQIDYIVAKCSVVAIDHHGALAKLAIEETGRGVFEDKAIKNLFASEYVINHMRNIKTVGVISEDSVQGLTYVAEPVGVIAGITPVTNPTSTVIFKILISLKTRNPIIFAFHPKAQKCSAETAKLLYEAALKAGAPEDCVQWIEAPSMEATNDLMQHEGVSTILATGGNAMVRAAYSCGKPALGVGAGNVPAYIEKSANLRQAVNDVVMSKAFDNGMVCASEQAVILDEEIYAEAKNLFKQYNVYFANAKEKALLEAFMFPPKTNEQGHCSVSLNPDVVGKSACWIAKQAGFDIPEKTSIIMVECAEVSEKEPLTNEKLSPVLAMLKAKDSKEGFDLAEKMVMNNGVGHSAAIHTMDEALAKEFGKRIKACRIIWNSPTTFGGIGNVYNSFIPSMTLGCGSYGHNSVSDNVSVVNLLNIKKIGRRRNNMQWFKIPPKIYFERDSIQYLSQMRNVERVFIVTDRGMVDLGFLNRVVDQLNRRRNKVQVQLFCDVESDPSIQTVQKGCDLMRNFSPDTIIALGGGSPMDAAKAMWLFYEHPEIDFNDIKQKFMDIRKRAFRVPEMGKKAQLVCIPTTSGTGSEVSPFTVITDKVENKKYPITDYGLTPNVAIVDPALVMSLPAKITAVTGLDVLTHATEAYVSVLASDFTDGIALQAIKMVFQYLKRSVDGGANDPLAREKMHNASTLAGMAFANAFLGMNHSMAHKIGARFHVVHGLCNSILLPYTIRYNGTKPEKPGVWPKYQYYNADERYAEIARAIGLNVKNTQDGVEKFAQAVEELSKSVGMPGSFKELGIDEKEWMGATEELAYLSYEDQCSPANPRIPMVKDVQQILENAYHGKK